MRHFALAAAVIVALAGCDNKEASKAPAGGGATTGGTTEPAKEPAKAAVAKHPWGSFKKGSFTKMKSVTEMDIAGTKNKSEMTMTYTLKDLTADDAIVETEMVMAAVPTPTKTEAKHPLKAPEGKATGDAPKPKTGSEDLDIAGKKLKCTWTETETEAAGAKTVSKVWMCDDVPGHMVKMSSKSPTMTSTMEVVEFSSK